MKKILLSSKKYLEKYTMVDDEDYIILKNFNLWIEKIGDRFYALLMVNGKKEFVHRFIINPPKNLQIDHKDNDGLNNCKINLRVCNTHQNAGNRKLGRNNTSGFKGVSLRADRGSYRAAIEIMGKVIYLGCHKTPEAAARAHDIGAIKYFGEFAKTNQSMGLLN